MVIGDSFTRGYWQDYFARMPAAMCGCTTSYAASACRCWTNTRRRLVILAPAERQMFCAGG